MTALNKLEALFPKEMFGCIIGEKGAKIKEVREKCGVQISNDKEVCRGGFRTIRFEGDWCSMWNAFCEVVKTIAEDERAMQNADVQLNGETFTVQVRLPKTIAGQVIGQKGANLNGWRAEWPECEFHVDEDAADNVFLYLITWYAVEMMESWKQPEARHLSRPPPGFVFHLFVETVTERTRGYS
tara:strand:+ start:3707 stop:4258 length:552 start_codon:yes stop_codon:yes gene_type:complete